MNARFAAPLVSGCLVLAACAPSHERSASTERAIAVTIDDLPVVSSRRDIESRKEITAKLLRHVNGARVPAIGFVNEGQLFPNGQRSEAEVDLLRSWLDAGLELGNHTYSHWSLNEKSLDAYMADVVRGETVTKELLAQKKKSLRFFRHPYLHTGRSIEIKRAFVDFIDTRG